MNNKIILLLALSTGLAATQEASAPKHEFHQWVGYCAQIAVTAGIYTGGAILQADYCRTEVTKPMVFVASIGVAKGMQYILSQNVFGFTKSDWASSENNYANFWGFVAASGVTAELDARNIRIHVA